MNLHDGQNLEEVVLREVLVRVVRVQCPEVIDQDIEDAQNNNQHDGAPLGLEANHHHNARHEAKQADSDAPEAPVAAEDEADEQEDQQDTARELEVHALILLIELRQSRGREPLAHPGVRQNHEQASHDRKIAEEEVQVEDEAVADALEDDDADEAENTVIRVLADDDLDRTHGHGDDVYYEEQVCDAVPDWALLARAPSAEADSGRRTVAVVVEICELVAPLCDDAQRILKEGNDNQETTYGGEITA